MDIWNKSGKDETDGHFNGDEDNMGAIRGIVFGVVVMFGSALLLAIILCIGGR